MANRQRLEDYGVSDSDLSRLDERVGEILAITEVGRSDSEQYGIGFEVRYNVLADAESGEVESAGLRAVTFAKPLVRDFLRILGDSSVPMAFDPPLVVALAQEGKTFRMVDV